MIRRAARGAAGRDTDDEALSSTRTRMLDAIRASPGMSVGDLRRDLGIAWSSLYHHLPVLVRAGRVRVDRQGTRRFLFPMDAPRVEAPVTDLSVLRGRTARQVAEVILSNPGIDVKGVVARAGVPPRVAYYHVRRLVSANLVLAASATRYRDLCGTQRLATILERWRD